MKLLLKLYLVLGIAVQFGVACFVDFLSFQSATWYQAMGMKLPYFTLLFISIRHWAFLWPVMASLLTAALLYKVRNDSILMHLFSVMMLVAVVIMALVSLAFFLPMIAMSSNVPH